MSVNVSCLPAAGPRELTVVVSIVATQPAWFDWRGGARGRPGSEWSTLIGRDPSRYCALIGSTLLKGALMP